MLALAGPAVGAGATGTRVTSSTALSELLRRVSGRDRKKAHGSTTAPSAGAGAAGATTTPTTTFVPSGGATAPTATSPTATSPPVTSPTVTSPTAARTAAPATPAATSASKPKAAKGDRRLSTGAIVIAALAALLVLACLGWALARNRAFEPHWLLALRHASAEAGVRASATWAELADWARLGR